MKKRFKNKVLASLLILTLIVSSITGFSTSAYAADSGADYTYYTSDEIVANYNFGSDVTAETLYSAESGYGFSDVTYPYEAAGWVNGIYYPRVQFVTGSSVYVSSTAVSGSAISVDTTSVSGSAITANELAIGSKVWTETESTGYGVYTYENTSVFSVDLANADYDVKVTLVNPTGSAYTAYLEAEDITKATGIEVAAGGTVETSIRAVLIDGQLNLKFLAASSATQESVASIQTVYVSNVEITRQATNSAAAKPTVFIASDSTVQTYDSYYYPQTGWGQVLYSFFGDFISESECQNCTYSQSQTYETESVVIENRAIGGRSSKSFIEEGKLDDLLEDVKPGDYVLVQWGHNDATYSRPNRYVAAGDFSKYLQYYIDGCRQRGATCILVTPVARYSYNGDGTFNSNFEAYRQAMITLGAAQGVPVLDLTGASIALCESLGIEGSKSLFLMLAAGDYTGYYAGGVSDSTHLQYYGAYKFAQCVAKLILSYSTDSQLDMLKTYIDLNIPTSVPAVVSNVTATSIGASSVSFSWDSAEGAELYYIYRAQLEAGQTIDSVDFSSADKYSVSSVTKYTDSNCEGGNTYVYAVRAFNEYGLGDLSAKISITTKSAAYRYDFCQSTTNPTLEGWTQVTSTQLYSVESGYGWITAPGNGRYRANNGNADSSDMADDFCLGAGEFAVDLPNGDYEVTVYACDLLPGTSTIKPSYAAEGNSIGTISTRQALASISATVRVTDGQLNVTVGGANAYINGMEITPLLLAPANLSYSELEFTETNATFLINFDGISEAVSYNIYQKSSTDTTFSLVKSILAADKDNLDARAMAAQIGETRKYYVSAITADGTETASSNVITIVMFDENADPPAAPVNLICSYAAEANIGIQWDAVEGAVSYNVYRSAKAEGVKGYTGFTKAGEATNPFYIDTYSDLDTNIHYYYKVEAVGIGGVGELSSALKTPITDTLDRTAAENFADRALVAACLAGSKGAEINVTTKDKDGNELTSGVFLSWRLLEEDPADITFTVYRNDTVIASDLNVTNCVDPEGTSGDVYRVVGSSDSSLGLTSAATDAWDNYYIEMQLEKPGDQVMPDGTTCTYTANDMSVGDLDKDGSYELIVKWTPSNSKDNSQSGYTGTSILDAYDMNTSTGEASLLWRIDLGVNIRSGAHYTQFQVWDFDGDGSAEIMCKTADGSTAYRNINGALVETGYVGACDASALPTGLISSSNDYRNSSGYVLSGPEYLTIFDGETGAIIDTTDYIPARGTVSAWGDGYGNRVDRFLSCVAYADGEHPSAVFCRGYYTRTCLTAYDFVDTDSDGVGNELQVRWRFDSDDYPSSEYGEIEAQGNHGLSVNDIDGDGKDEIIYGALVVDHDGTLKYTTHLGHGDAMHVSDWVPSNPGLEVFSVHEHTNSTYQVELHDAETGEVLWGYYTGVDTGRGVAADIDPTHPGGELWANTAWNGVDGGLYSSLSTFTNPVKLSELTPSVNFTIYWDGDLLKENQDHTFDSTAYVPISTNITNWDYVNKVPVILFESTEIYTSNGTKGNLGLVADILGDWREEIIARTSADAGKIRIYTSTIVTDYVIPCLMENYTYRIGVAWQNVGYNQPANLDYLLTEGLLTSQLIAASATTNSVTISFTAASDGTYGHVVEGYAVYRKGNESAYELIDTLYPDTLNSNNASGYIYTDTSVTPNRYYSYRIAAIVDGKTSYLSNSVEVNTLVDITSVSDFELDPIVEDTPLTEGSTVAALLPSTLEVTDSDNNRTTANVTWDVSNVDLTTPGNYTVVATVEGYSETIEKMLTVLANKITTYEFSGYNRTGTEEPYYTYFSVQNAALNLPAAVIIHYLNGTSEEAAVTWDTSAVDVTANGTYVAIGTTGVLTASNGKFGTQTVKMNVEIQDDFITSVGDIASVDFVIGSTVEELRKLLPATVTVNYKSGTQGNAAVDWNTDISETALSTEGYFYVSGTVENYSGEVKIKVNVDYKAIWKFDFGIYANQVAEGWTGVTVNPKGVSKTADVLGLTYTSDKGYGFLDGSAVISGRYESYTQSGTLPELVYRDFAIPDGQTFVADVPNGIYNVEFVSGSAYSSSVKVTVEGSSTVTRVSNSANTYNIGEVTGVEVNDGQMTLYFASSNVSRLDAVVIRLVSLADSTATPTPEPTATPTPEPTVTPTPEPTATPTPEPTATPTPEPTATPTPEPTATPTPEPTATPTPEPTATPTPEPIVGDLSKIKVKLTEDTLYVGGTTGKFALITIELPQVIIDAIEDNLVREEITYESSNKKVVSVTEKGEIIAKAEGSATITTTITIGGKTKTFTNEITVKSAYIEIAAKTDKMIVGEVFTFTVKCYGYKPEDVKYSTTRKSVVEISKTTGIATAVSKGTDYIIIKCNKKTIKIEVIVE